MAQNLTTFDAILKDIYLAPIRDQLNSSTILLARLARNTEDVSGRDAVIPLAIGRNEGIGARPDGGSLPNPQRQRFKDTRVPMRYNYGVIEVTGPTIAASRNDAGAFGRAVDLEVQGMTRDLRKDVNRQLFGDGTGLLATVAAASSGAKSTILVNSTKHLRRGMVIDVRDMATGAIVSGGAGLEILAVDTANSEITVDNSVNTLPAHGLYREDAYNQELTGLGALVDDADRTIQGIDRSAVPEFKSHVLNAPGGFLTTNLMQRAIDTAEEAANGIISLITTSYAGRRAYTNLLEFKRRYVNTLTLDGGFEAVEYNQRPLVPDTDCQDDRMYFLDESTLGIYAMSDWDWMDKDGAILSRVAGKDAYQAVLYLYAELGCHTPARNVRIDGIDENAMPEVPVEE